MKNKTRDLLNYPPEPDEPVIVCKYGKNHGRIGKVLHKWDGRSVMSDDYEHLAGKECYVVMSVGSPFVYEPPINDIYYSIKKSHLLVVEIKHLKRLAHKTDIKWELWK
jgi:hypothetical protein